MGLKNKEVFAKTKILHSSSSTLTKSKQKKTINTAFIFLYIWLKAVSQISKMCVCFTLQTNIFGDDILLPHTLSAHKHQHKLFIDIKS